MSKINSKVYKKNKIREKYKYNGEKLKESYCLWVNLTYLYFVDFGHRLR